MNTTVLPEGVTPEMMQAIAAFMQSQQAALQRARPSGTLQPNQIRGVNPNYRYKYREFPKALDPPSVTVVSVAQERTLRARWNQPLPWADRDMMDAYYDAQEYPKEMLPPQVVVNSSEEEESMLASWHGKTGRVNYPRWMFHAEKEAVMVRSHDEQVALGAGWFPTVKEAIAAAQADVRNYKQPSEREQLMDKAHQMGIEFKPQWSTDRLREAVEAAEKEAEAA